MLDLREAIQLLETGNWVSLHYVSYDSKKGTAGEIIRLPKCRLFGSSPGAQPASNTQAAAPTRSLAQNHHLHSTRNFKLANGSVRKVHLRLIFQINDQRIL